MKLKLTILLLSLLALTSCDFFSDGYIKNDTDKDVIIIAKLDPDIIKHYSPSAEHFLNSFDNDSTCEKLRIDPSNLIGVYLLKSKGSVWTDGGNDKYCTTKFCYLQIRKFDDTLTYYSNKEIKKAFTMDKEPGYHELTIK